ncbi:MAG: ribonuclease Z, partial [Methanobacteriota archaeon]
IHEATFTKEHEETAKVSGHSTAEQAAYIAAKSRVKALLLYHISPRYTRLDPLILEARKHFKNTWIPDDLSTVEITPNHTIHLHLDNTKIVL